MDANYEVLQRWASEAVGLDFNGAFREVASNASGPLPLDANGIAQRYYGSDLNAAFGPMSAALLTEQQNPYSRRTLWRPGDNDWAKFTEVPVSNVGTINLTQADGNGGFATGNNATDDDRRIYLYTDMPASANMEVRLTWKGNGQCGVALRGDANEAIIAWSNIVFGANATIIQGVWEYNGVALLSTNQHATSLPYLAANVVSAVGNGTLITVTLDRPHMIVAEPPATQGYRVTFGPFADAAVNATYVSARVFTFPDATVGSWSGTARINSITLVNNQYRTLAARIIGNNITFKQWYPLEAEPAWDDPLRSRTNALPALLASSGAPPQATGKAGIVLAHFFNTGRSLTVRDFSVRILP